MTKTQTEAVASVIVNTANALTKVQNTDHHPEIKSEIQRHLIDVQQQSIEFAKKIYPN
jgi:hypothetical protein